MRAALAAALLLAAIMPGSGMAQVFDVSTVSQFDAALDTAQTNGQADTINLVAGTFGLARVLIYTPLENFSLTINGAGAGKTIIDGGGSFQLLRINTTGVLPSDASADVTIRGVTFRNGNAVAGGGVFVQTFDAPVTVESSEFLGCSGGRGGGLFVDTASGPVRVVNNIFGGCAADTNGGGAYVETNTAAVNFTNNTFAENSASAGGGLYLFLLTDGVSGASAEIFNNIIWGNDAASGGDLFIEDDGNDSGNGSSVNIDFNDFANLESGCTGACLPNIVEGLNNIDAAPLVDSADFRLLANSPAIDAGSNSASGVRATDIDGDSRALDGDDDGTVVVDMGADEFVFTPPEDEQPPPGDGGAACFISTAAFGSSLAGEVEILRRFRDEHLLGSPLGRALVGFYYRHSPPLARYIAAHGTLRAAVRLALAPVLYGFRHPGLAVLFALALGAAVYRKLRKG